MWVLVTYLQCYLLLMSIDDILAMLSTADVGIGNILAVLSILLIKHW